MSTYSSADVRRVVPRLVDNEVPKLVARLQEIVLLAHLHGADRQALDVASEALNSFWRALMGLIKFSADDPSAPQLRGSF